MSVAMIYRFVSVLFHGTKLILHWNSKSEKLKKIFYFFIALANICIMLWKVVQFSTWLNFL